MLGTAVFDASFGVDFVREIGVSIEANETEKENQEIAGKLYFRHGLICMVIFAILAQKSTGSGKNEEYALYN